MRRHMGIFSDVLQSPQAHKPVSFSRPRKWHWSFSEHAGREDEPSLMSISFLGTSCSFYLSFQSFEPCDGIEN